MLDNIERILPGKIDSPKDVDILICDNSIYIPIATEAVENSFVVECKTKIVFAKAKDCLSNYTLFLMEEFFKLKKEFKEHPPKSIKDYFIFSVCSYGDVSGKPYLVYKNNSLIVSYHEIFLVERQEYSKNTLCYRLKATENFKDDYEALKAFESDLKKKSKLSAGISIIKTEIGINIREIKNKMPVYNFESNKRQLKIES